MAIRFFLGINIAAAAGSEAVAAGTKRLAFGRVHHCIPLSPLPLPKAKRLVPVLLARACCSF